MANLDDVTGLAMDSLHGRHLRVTAAGQFSRGSSSRRPSGGTTIVGGGVSIPGPHLMLDTGSGSLTKRLSLPRIIAATLLLVALVGCGPKTATWSEEVRLQSGDVLTVRRTMRFEAYQPAGGGGGSDVLESTLEVIAPAPTDVPARWSGAPLLPLVFDRDDANQEWFIVATFYMCTAWYDLGRPKLPYAEFRYQAGRWVQVPLSEKFIGREGNMLVPNQADTDRNHTLASKDGAMSRPTVAEEYKRVVSSWKTQC